MTHRIIGLLAAGAGALGAAGTAHAQTPGSQQDEADFFRRDRYTAVADRQQPAFDPRPLQLGGLEVRSSLSAGARYESNVFGSANNEESDIILSLRPDVQARTNWRQHELSGFGYAETREYLDFSDESATDYGFGFGGRLDATRQFSFDANSNLRKDTERRYDFAARPDAAEPVEYTTARVGVGAQFENGRFRIRGAAEHTNQEFDDVARVGGGMIDQDFRDNHATRFSGRVSYATSPSVAVFVQASTTDFDYRAPRGTATDRDSTNRTYEAGVDFELPNLMRGDIGVGFLQSEYDDPRVPDVDGLSLNARLQWFITELTTITFAGRRGVQDSGVENLIAGTSTDLSARLDHELLRRLIVYGELGRNDIEIELPAIDAESTFGRAGGVFKLNPNVGIDFGYQYSNSEFLFVPGFDATSHGAYLTLRLYP
jgi:hypothetical protein